jgi:hemerythrin-like domain-containing protein
MYFNLHTSQRLHEEHLATVALWGRLEQAIASRLSDDEIHSLCKQCAAALSNEVSRHFDFEERELFPRLREAGESDIAELLGEEHETIRAVARDFQPLVAAAAPDAAAWQRIRALGLELAERLVAHIQKEEMALLPALEDLLDEETDREIALAHAES